MNILIYENSIEDLDNLTVCINEYFINCELDYNIKICNNSDDIYTSLLYFDLIFLDIELDHENGIDIGLKIREKNNSVKIVITSRYKKYLIDGYKINADRYFLKPINRNVFTSEMNVIVKDYLYKQAVFYDPTIIKDRLLINDIIYIEFIQRKSFIYMINGKTYETSNSLKNWAEVLKNFSFSYSHKSFIVNLGHISSYNSKEIYMINNITIPLSRYYKNDFEELYVQNIFKRM